MKRDACLLAANYQHIARISRRQTRMCLSWSGGRVVAVLPDDSCGDTCRRPTVYRVLKRLFSGLVSKTVGIVL